MTELYHCNILLCSEKLYYMYTGAHYIIMWMQSHLSHNALCFSLILTHWSSGISHAIVTCSWSKTFVSSTCVCGGGGRGRGVVPNPEINSPHYVATNTIELWVSLVEFQFAWVQLSDVMWFKIAALWFLCICTSIHCSMLWIHNKAITEIFCLSALKKTFIIMQTPISLLNGFWNHRCSNEVD